MVLFLAKEVYHPIVQCYAVYVMGRNEKLEKEPEM